MTPENRIFISYAHADQQDVFPTIQWLKRNGYSLWVDESIRAGESWRDEIAVAIEESAIVLFFASKNSVASDFCRKEVAYALETDTPVTTVLLDAAELPSGLKLGLADTQAIRAYELSEFELRDSILETLNRLLETHGSKGDTSMRPVSLKNPVDVQGHVGARTREAQPIVAVMPFANHSGDPDQTFFSDGIAEEILSGLSRQKGLRTIARTSAWQFRDKSTDVREIGRQLNATHILEGSVRKAGDRVRVSVQLIEVTDGIPIWSEKYQREIVDIFDVQDDITEEILLALRLQFQPMLEGAQTSSQAYEAYLTARLHYNMLDFDQARKYAEESISLDPKYVPAYIMMTGMHILKVFYWFDSMENALPSIKYYGKLALSLDKDNVVAKCLAHQVNFFVNHTYEDSLNDILELNAKHPNDDTILFILGPMNQALQRFDKTVEVLDKLLEIDPLSPMYHRFRAEILTLSGKYNEAKETLDHTARLGAPDPMQYGFLAFMQGDLDGLKSQAELMDSDLGPEHLYTIATKARILFLEEKHEQTTEMLSPLMEMASAGKFHYLEAMCAQLCNDKDRFLDKLETALNIGEFPAFQNYTLKGIWKERYQDVLEGDRYQSILANVGLDDASLSKLSIRDA